MDKEKMLREVVIKKYKEMYDHDPSKKFITETIRNIKKKYNPLKLKPEDIEKELKKEADNIEELIRANVGYRFGSRIFTPNSELLKELVDKVKKKTNLPYYDLDIVDEVIIKWLKENNYETQGYISGEGLGLTGHCKMCNIYVVNVSKKETGFVDERFISYGEYIEEEDNWICERCKKIYEK